MSHTLHDDVHTAGLEESCPRCQEHIADPLAQLDQEMLERLYRRQYHSLGDMKAGEELHSRLRAARELLHRFGEIG